MVATGHGASILSCPGGSDEETIWNDMAPGFIGMSRAEEDALMPLFGD
jgi:hypothetical protein